MSIKDKLKEVLLGLQAKGYMQTDAAVLVDENLDKVVAIVEDVHEALEDGLQWEDLSTLATVVGDLVELADEMEDMTNEDKAKFVENAIYAIYKFYDPDIPFVPEFGGIEDRLEHAVIPKAAHFAVETAVAIYKKFKNRD